MLSLIARQKATEAFHYRQPQKPFKRISLQAKGNAVVVAATPNNVITT